MWGRSLWALSKVEGLQSPRGEDLGSFLSPEATDKGRFHGRWVSVSSHRRGAVDLKPLNLMRNRNGRTDLGIYDLPHCCIRSCDDWVKIVQSYTNSWFVFRGSVLSLVLWFRMEFGPAYPAPHHSCAGVPRRIRVEEPGKDHETMRLKWLFPLGWNKARYIVTTKCWEITVSEDGEGFRGHPRLVRTASQTPNHGWSFFLEIEVGVAIAFDPQGLRFGWGVGGGDSRLFTLVYGEGFTVFSQRSPSPGFLACEWTSLCRCFAPLTLEIRVAL